MKLLIRLIVITAVLGSAWAGYRVFQQLPQKQQQVATTTARQGDVVIRTYARGELRAVRSVTLITPNLFSTVQVTQLAALGALAREKDLIVEFDDSERRSALEEAELEVEQVDEQIKKAQADLDIRNNQDQVELLNARYAVRRAELEVKRNELLSAIDARRNILNLEEARRRLKQLESDIKSRQQQALAEIAVYRERRNKASIDTNREKQRIAQSKVLSPMTGLVSIRQNRQSGFFFPGMQIPDIREGDTLQPGMPVADILDLSELEVVAKVGELDRANLREGQDVIIRLDAVPDKQFNGKIKAMSGTASSNVFAMDPAKKFDVVFGIDMKQLLSELGAKPEQIQKIMETAARNAKRAPDPQPVSMMVGGPGGPGGGPSGGPGGGPSGGPGGGLGGGPGGGLGGGPSGGPGGGPGGGMIRVGGPGGEPRSGGQMSAEDRTKFREAMQKALGDRKMEDLSPEERQKVMAKVRESVPGLPAGVRGGRGGGAGPGGMPAPPAGPAAETQADRDRAKLPPAPEEDTQLEALLRPGLLADVEIIVEKIPDVIHLPGQAIFEKDGKAIIYVRQGGRFEPREVKLGKRSESTVVIAQGLEPGELVALADPEAERGGGKKSEKKKSGGNPMNPLGGGGGGGNAGGGGRKGGR